MTGSEYTSPLPPGCLDNPAATQPLEEDEETPQLMRTKSDAACVVQRRPRCRAPGEAQKIRRHRFSINGHFYNHKTSVFTPAYGSMTNVRVNSTMTTLQVLTLLLNKFRVENGPSEFALYMVHESGERTKLKDCEYPLISRILHGPCEKIAKIFLMEADLGEEVPHDDSTHGTGQDLVHGDPRATSLQEAQVPHDSSRAQDVLRGGAGPSGSRDEAYRAWSLQRHRLEKLVAKLVPAVLGGHPSYVNTFLGSYRTFATAQQVLDHLFRRLEKLVANLVPAMLGGNPSYLRTFLGSCRSFATAQQVLDLLLQRYGCILPFTEEDGGPLHQLKQAMASILGTWLLQFPDDFHQPPEFPCLKTIVTYIELSMAGSDLEQQAHLLLTQLEQLELPEADSDAPEPESDTEPEQRDVLSCEAAASSPLSAVDPGPSSGPPSTLPETPPLAPPATICAAETDPRPCSPRAAEAASGPDCPAAAEIAPRPMPRLDGAAENDP
ncbi:hypothetical protein CB1_000037001 [Camelus ferus]|nr:hypothetical protein CB1_000037001 [Camelus ferus]